MFSAILADFHFINATVVDFDDIIALFICFPHIIEISLLKLISRRISGISLIRGSQPPPPPMPCFYYRCFKVTELIYLFSLQARYFIPLTTNTAAATDMTVDIDLSTGSIEDAAIYSTLIS